MSNDFRFLRLGAASRLILAGALFAAGIAFELAIGKVSFLYSFLVIAIGWLPLMLRKATNKPEDQGLEEWRPVPMEEIDRLDDGLRESRKLVKKTRNRSAVLALAVGIPAFLILFIVLAIAQRTDAYFVAVNAMFLFVPAFFFGRIRVFTPKDIAMKMPCFRALLAEKLPEGIVVAPYIRFDKDKAGADVPEDLRLLYELKRSPSDLVGIQVQAAINNGPNGAVPYAYAVVLTKGKSGPSYAAARRARADGFEFEVGGDEDYGTVVMRQKTSGGGYETNTDDCRRLLGLCLEVLDGLPA